MSIPNPLQSATEMVKRIRVSSILAPVLWILPYSMAALMFIAVFSDDVLVKWVFVIINSSLFIVLVASFIGILLFGDKKLLCSEEHIEQMRALEILGDQKNTLNVNDNIPAKTNPELPNPKNTDIPISHKNKEIK